MKARRLKSVDRLEKEYRQRRKAEGEKKLIISWFLFTEEAEAYCLVKQLSRSEYVLELLHADRDNRARVME